MATTIRLILFVLFLHAVNCQLAFLWLRYQHFQCAQNTRNYHESVRDQYLCTLSLIRTCISDVNPYSHSSVIFLNYFCGFIDGRNALQPHMVWDIHMKPNIKIHFVKFKLLHTYWYCDYEFVRVYSNNKSITFCGNRLPWVYDASDTRLKIMLVTHHSSIDNYRLELLYYGAYVQARSQHFVMFTHQTSIVNTHTPNTEQYVFESFHFISTSRLNILQLEAMNICRKEQVICYDGPGDKSPVLQFTYNHSEWKCLSTTFQMVCTFSRANNVCTKIPYLRYYAVRESDHHVKTLFEHEDWIIEKFDSKGTSKYIYYHPGTVSSYGLIICSRRMFIASPYMLYEGNSCMYGGIYIKTLSSKDFELISICALMGIHRQIPDINNVSIVIIHYSEYFSKILTSHGHVEILKALYFRPIKVCELTWLNQQYLNEETVSITVPKLPQERFRAIQSDLLKLRKVRYINISLDYEGIASCLGITMSPPRDPCIAITIFFSSHFSNIRGMQYDQETEYGPTSFLRCGLIKSSFINMNGCDLWNIPVWTFLIETTIQHAGGFEGLSIRHLNIPTIAMYMFHQVHSFPPPDFWFMVQFVRPEEVPPNAIYNITISDTDILSNVSIEAPTDKYQSSSVYGWNQLSSSTYVYMTVTNLVNILFEFDNSVTKEQSKWRPGKVCYLRFIRHFIYDDRMTKYLTGQPPEQIHFTFHNQR